MCSARFLCDGGMLGFLPSSGAVNPLSERPAALGNDR